MLAWVTGAMPAPAQHGSSSPPAARAGTTATAPAPAKLLAEQKRGAGATAVHAPLPALHPLVAWQHVKDGNAAAVAALAAQQPLPAPAERPAGAGRFVCAVLVCADAGVDPAPLLGLRRSDVLLLSAPGPFATPETTALLERAVAEERLSLVLVLTHADCGVLAPRTTPDVLTRRLEALRAEAARRQQPLPKTLAQLQRDQLFAASEFLRQRSEQQELRIVPATIDPRTGALVWHVAHAETMPIAPVK